MEQYIISETVTPDYVFFWKGVFSQWHRTKFTVSGQVYNTCEQWMMAQKAAVFGDIQSHSAILASPSPREQKALGRRVRGFNQEIWDKVKLDIVIYGNWARSQEDGDFRYFLLATGERTLVEASPYDTVWGIGFTAKDALDNIDEWGENLLGEALMLVRAALRNNLPPTLPRLDQVGSGA